MHALQEANSLSASDQSDICRVCGGKSTLLFTLSVIGHRVGYFDCPSCGYVQTESPHWLEQAYARAINDGDTGILSRNLLNLGRVISTLWASRKIRGRVVDHAGGYGILVRLLRDAGVDAWWRDRYCANLVARGFEADGGQYDLLTAFEVFEHMVEPVAELRAMLQEAPTVLLSTELILTTEPPAADWWYLGPQHGQHIGFFRAKTLEWIAKEIGCHYRTDGVSVHLFSRTPIPDSWAFWLRLSRYWRYVTRFTLQSKTVLDSEQLRRAGR